MTWVAPIISTFDVDDNQAATMNKHDVQSETHHWFVHGVLDNTYKYCPKAVAMATAYVCITDN